MTVLEPAAQAFADAAAQPPFMFQLPLATGRAKLVELQSGSVEKPDVETTDLDVDTSPSHRVPVRVVRPRDTEGDLPVILYLHAGWAFGDVVTHDRLVRELADGVDAAVVFPSFSLSPEAQYPTALEEIYAVAEWIDGEGASLGLDSSRIAVAGDSAGGNMATAITIMTKQRGGPKFVHQMLLYPTLDANFDTPSYREFADRVHVCRDHMQWLWDQYVPDATRRSEITAAPLRYGRRPRRVAARDHHHCRSRRRPRRRRGIRQQAPAGGSAHHRIRYLGTIHDFMFLDALKSTEAGSRRRGTSHQLAADLFRTGEGPRDPCHRRPRRTRPPPRYKVALLTWIGIYPVIAVLLAASGTKIGRYPVAVRALVLTACVIPIMTWLVMPLLTRVAAGGCTAKEIAKVTDDTRPRSSCVEERRDQCEHFGGPLRHAHVRRPGSTASCASGRSSNISTTSDSGEKSRSPKSSRVGACSDRSSSVQPGNSCTIVDVWAANSSKCSGSGATAS